MEGARNLAGKAGGIWYGVHGAFLTTNPALRQQLFASVDKTPQYEGSAQRFYRCRWPDKGKTWRVVGHPESAPLPSPSLTKCRNMKPMALIYLGRSEAEWLQLFTAVKAEELAATNGERFISVSTGGKSYQRRVRSMDEIAATYGQCLTALQVLNPTAYGQNTQTINVSFGGYAPK